jgi:hypothetical protein
MQKVQGRLDRLRLWELQLELGSLGSADEAKKAALRDSIAATEASLEVQDHS